MSQSDILNKLINHTIGWDAKVYYAKKDPGDAAVVSGWFIASDYLFEDHYLGTNYGEALENIVLYGDKFSSVAEMMFQIREGDPERFHNTRKMLKLDEPLDFLFPELVEPEESAKIVTVHATTTDRAISFLLGAGFMLGVGMFLFAGEIATFLVGTFGYVH